MNCKNDLLCHVYGIQRHGAVICVWVFDVFQSLPRMPAPPPIDDLDSLENDTEALHSMLISWYLSGYHTGYYQVRIILRLKPTSRLLKTSRKDDVIVCILHFLVLKQYIFMPKCIFNRFRMPQDRENELDGS